MLGRSGPLPTGDYAYELKWDGFRCLISTAGRLRVLSRQWWEMTPHLPELARLPRGDLLWLANRAALSARPPDVRRHVRWPANLVPAIVHATVVHGGPLTGRTEPRGGGHPHRFRATNDHNHRTGSSSTYTTRSTTDRSSSRSDITPPPQQLQYFQPPAYGS